MGLLRLERWKLDKTHSAEVHGFVCVSCRPGMFCKRGDVVVYQSALVAPYWFLSNLAGR